MSYLNEVTIEITQQCNSNCIYCSSLSGSTAKNKIELSKLKEISSFCKNNGATEICISGGEPFLHNNLYEYLIYNTSLSLKSRVYSSFNIGNEYVFEQILNEMNPSSIKFIINYPSSQEEIYAKIAGVDANVMVSVNKKIAKCINKGYSVEAHVVPTALNIDSLYKTTSFLKSIGLSQVSFLRLVLQGRATNWCNILEIKPIVELNKYLHDISNALSDDLFKVRIGIPFNSNVMECACFAGIHKLIFRYDGKVFPCEAFKEAPNNSDFCLGSIYNSSIEEIWIKALSNYSLLNLRNNANILKEPCPAQLLYS